ncbi:unnamed protein product, partial [Ectocarpus sp. 13 AM-2016]
SPAGARHCASYVRLGTPTAHPGPLKPVSCLAQKASWCAVRFLSGHFWAFGVCAERSHGEKGPREASLYRGVIAATPEIPGSSSSREDHGCCCWIRRSSWRASAAYRRHMILTLLGALGTAPSIR